MGQKSGCGWTAPVSMLIWAEQRTAPMDWLRLDRTVFNANLRSIPYNLQIELRLDRTVFNANLGFEEASGNRGFFLARCLCTLTFSTGFPLQNQAI
jgi:hypothetical protein